MIKLPPKSPLQPLIIRRLMEVMVLVLLIGSTVYGFQHTKTARQELLAEQRALEHAPQEQIMQSSNKFDLRQHSENIDQLDAAIPFPDQLGDVVNHVEQRAEQLNVELNIPDVREVVQLNADGAVIPRSGPTFEISLTIIAVGEPTNLIQFLHAVEYAPYVMNAANWHFEKNPGRVPGFAITQPDSTPVDNEEETTATPIGLLNAEFIIVVRNDEA